MVDLVEETILAYEASAEDYFGKNNDMSKVEPEALMFLAMLDLPPKKILDVGCGHGRDAKYFSEKGYRVEGIDLSDKLLEKARAQAPKADFYRMDMRKMTFPDETFDGLWSMASLLHLPPEEASSAMKEYHRVLKSSGLMYLSVLEGNGPDSLPATPKYGNHSKYFYTYGQDEFHALVKDNGFDINFQFMKEIDTSKKIIKWLGVLAKKIT